MAVDTVPMKIVWPSLGAVAAISAAILLAAPARLSTTTGWPSASDKFWLIARATTSVAPPAGKPTRKRTCLAGYICAATLAHINSAVQLNAASVSFSVSIASLSFDEMSGVSSGQPAEHGALQYGRRARVISVVSADNFA